MKRRWFPVAFAFVCLSLAQRAPQAYAAGSDKVYVEDRLPNNMELISVQQRKVPIVTIVLTFKAGSKTETKDINGLTHVWEHMFFTGNQKLKSEADFQKRGRELGMVYNATTSAEYVRYYFTLPSVFLNEGLELMADCIKTPRLSQESLKNERVVVLDEYDRSASQPGFDLGRVKDHVLYGDQAHRRSPIGIRSIIEKVNRDTLLKIREQVFVPSNAALLISGDFEYDTLKKLVQKHFNNWTDPKGWKALKMPDFPAFPATTELIEANNNAQNIEISYTFKGPRVGVEDADTIYADILTQVLGLRNGPFYKKFVDSGLSLGSGFSYYTQGDVGEFVVYGSTTAKNAAKLQESLLSELNEWTSPSYYKQQQLDDVSRALSIDYKRDLNKPSEFVKELSFHWAVSGMRYFDNYLNALSKTTIANLVDLAKRYFIKKPYIKTILINSAEAKELGIKDNLDSYLKKFGLKRSSP